MQIRFGPGAKVLRLCRDEQKVPGKKYAKHGNHGRLYLPRAIVLVSCVVVVAFVRCAADSLSIGKTIRSLQGMLSECSVDECRDAMGPRVGGGNLAGVLRRGEGEQRIEWSVWPDSISPFVQSENSSRSMNSGA